MIRDPKAYRIALCCALFSLGSSAAQAPAQQPAEPTTVEPARATAADAATGYRLPPSPIPEILSARPTPTVSVSPDHSTLAILERDGMPGIETLAEPELRLGGVRINPRTNGPSRAQHAARVAFLAIEDGIRRDLELPPDARVSHLQWSPDGTRVAFVNTVADGLELWVADAATARTRRVLGPELNAVLGSPFEWTPDGRSLLVKRIVPGRGAPPPEPLAPAGPVVQENIGRAAPVRTFQDLLSNSHDEALFEHYFTAQLARVPAAGGAPVPIGDAGIIASFSNAPGGDHILIRRLKRPFSYVAPFFAFGAETVVLDAAGRAVHVVEDRQEVTLSPIGRDMVNPGPRAVHWRADAAATLAWVEAADEGDALRPAEVRDRVLLLEAPFTGTPRTLIELDQRYAGIVWGRADAALVQSRWTTTSRSRTWLVDPSRPDSEPKLLYDRSFEDRYGDPGSPLTTTTTAGFRVLQFSPDGSSIFLSGEGASPRGSYPFLDRLHLETAQAERLWQAEDPYYETLVATLDAGGQRLLTRRESSAEPPNYFVRDRHAGTVVALTRFPDPAPQLAGLQREIITYPREDGVLLSATLYAPPGYEPDRDGPLPMLVWAYPREFRDADAASQVTTSPNRFARPSGSSHLFLLTQGYAILDGPAMPIIGEGDVEPNDTYVAQLVASARAAVDKVVEMGVAERDRIGIGGHSYGAFMTANLLAHSDLFRVGIARSGAYNRTLTPFGFQAERRSYWEATDIYHRMSPFNYADRIEAPILLIHGEADNNSGTFPIQSERMFQALKGHGATVRYVVLPHESHGYVARESVLHALAEMVEWMDRWVKGAESPRAAAGGE